VFLREVKATHGEVVREVVDVHDVRLSYTAVAQIELLPAPTTAAEPTAKVLRFGAGRGEVTLLAASVRPPIRSPPL
jgi:hypothetical protein